MMRNNFSVSFEQLRRENRYSREQVAEMMGVTYREICQWECGEAYPPIDLVPVIANLFHVSADYLLGVNMSASEAKIERLLDDAMFFSKQLRYREAIAILQKAAILYPSDDRISCSLADNLLSYRKSRPSSRDEAVLILKKLLEKSHDAVILSRALALLVGLYAEEGNTEAAKEYASLLPSFELSREYQTGKNRFLTVQERVPCLLSDACRYLDAAKDALTEVLSDEYAAYLSDDEREKAQKLLKEISL